MFASLFIFSTLIVAGIWGYFLLIIARNNKRILEDEALLAKENQRKEAKRAMRMIHLFTPVWVFVVVVVILLFVNASHPFIQLDTVGIALAAGGLFFTYLGWAIGMAIRGADNNIEAKDAKLLSRVFMISFMGSGILITAIGIIICAQPFIYRG